MASCSVESSQIQQRLHDFLLRDTNGGKLYKYRAFDEKGYALKNLKEGTLHCSRPDAFNDPFDCKIGVSFHTLCEAKYGFEFDMIGAIFNKFILVVQNKMEIEACSADEQRIIRKLFFNEMLMCFVKDGESKAETEEELALIRKENVFAIVKLMKTIFEDEAFIGTLGEYADIFPRFVDGIAPDDLLKLFDERVTFSDYVRANGVLEDTDEIGLAILLNKKVCPENADAYDELHRRIEDMERQIDDKINSLFRVGCLSTDFKNRLMWSHYADSHKGFCVEYDFSDIDKDTSLNLPLPIFYSESRPLVPWKAALEKTAENIEDARTQLVIGLLTKDSAWEYENEWRILIESTESTEYKMPKISCIYLGAAICEKNRTEILKIARKLCVPVKQMKVDRSAYDLHAEDVLL